jgi:hypothetical protein
MVFRLRQRGDVGGVIFSGRSSAQSSMYGSPSSSYLVLSISFVLQIRDEALGAEVHAVNIIDVGFVRGQSQKIQTSRWLIDHLV